MPKICKEHIFSEHSIYHSREVLPQPCAQVRAIIFGPHPDTPFSTFSSFSRRVCGWRVWNAEQPTPSAVSHCQVVIGVLCGIGKVSTDTVSNTTFSEWKLTDLDLDSPAEATLVMTGRALEHWSSTGAKVGDILAVLNPQLSCRSGDPEVPDVNSAPPLRGELKHPTATTLPELPETSASLPSSPSKVDRKKANKSATTRSLGAPSPTSPNSVASHVEGIEGLSESYRLLIIRLVQQHLEEMAALEDKIKLEEFERRLDYNMMSDTCTLSGGKSDEVRRQFEKISSRTSTFAKKHRREINADEVLDAMGDEEEIEELFKADPLQEGLVEESEPHLVLTRGARFEAWLQSTSFDMVIAGMVFVNVLWMALKLQIDGSITGNEMGIYADPPMSKQSQDEWQVVTMWGDALFAGLFTLDVGIRIVILRFHFWRFWLNYVDVAVTIVSIMEVLSYYAIPIKINAALFRLLRIGKLARAVRMLPVTNALGSLQLLVKGLVASRGMLFWSFCLLTFLQCVAGMIISTLCRDYLLERVSEAANSVEVRDVFTRYGTFSRTMLTMFEILFANWGPPARILVDNVSEWYSIFFLLYRCVLGFAVINVVNAIFVQQTLKTASSDEELSFRQKEKDIQLYASKVKKLFQTMDFSGDGAINLEEFSKLVKSPKLKFWMSQLELEYHDLLSLFEFLDNGDGQITLTEFIEGAARLRGGAKALDIWRIETKLEVLFEEVLSIMKCFKVEKGSRRPSVQSNKEGEPIASGSQSIVQDVFNNSLYRHIQSTSRNRQRSHEAS
ncbi:unnamed protein product [Durusdinium trenchii]|uniref:EF-hand domain-containing protein n=1 Tax=Durusdinium trenchii TaxID=1381693 RepID=A0ABP0K724_9DINO